MYVHVCFLDPPSQKNNKKKHGVQGSFQKKTQQEVFPQPGIMDFRGEAPPPASRFFIRPCWSTFGFFNKTSWISAAGGWCDWK